MSLTTVEIEAFSGPALVEIVGSDEPSVVQIVSSEQPEVVYINQGPAGLAGPNSVTSATTSDGTANLTVNSESFNLAPTGTATVGRLQWNDTDGTLDLGLKGGNVTLQIGQEQVIRVVNKTNPLITLTESAFQAVRVTGAQGQRLKVDLALATSDLGSATTIGIVTETITGNQEGFITTSGVVRGIDTRGTAFGEAWADGDVLYLSPLIAGRITNVKPAAPQHTVIIGWVVNATVNGSIFVKVDNGYELNELHNVAIAHTGNPLSVNDILTCYDSTSNSGYWKNTPLSDVAVTLTGNQTISGVKIFSDQVILDSPTIGDTATLSQLNWNILPDGSGTFASLSTNAGSSNYWSISQTGAAYFKGVLTLSGNYGSSSGRIDFDKDTGSDGSLYPLALTGTRSWELPNASGTIALDSTALMLTGTQTAAGAKSFSGQMELTGQSATNATSAMTRDLADARYFSQRSDNFSFFEDFDGINPYGSNMDSSIGGTAGGTIAPIYDATRIGSIRVTTAAATSAWGRVRRYANTWLSLDSKAFDFCFIVRLQHILNTTVTFGGQNSTSFQTNIPTFYYTAAGTATTWKIQHLGGVIDTGYTATIGWVFLRMWRTTTTGNTNWEIRDTRLGTVRASGSSALTMTITPYDFGVSITAATASAVAFDIDYTSLFIPNLTR